MGKIINKTTSDFVITKNVVVHEPRLSLKAKGIYTLMISLPDGWEFSVKGLGMYCKDGKDGIGSALRELEEASLLRRQIRFEEETGKIDGFDYIVYDTPFPEVSPLTEKPSMDSEGNSFDSNRIDAADESENGVFLSKKPFTDLPLTEKPSMDNSNNSLAGNELEEIEGKRETEREKEAKRDRKREKEKEKRKYINIFSKKETLPVFLNPPTFDEVNDYFSSNGLKADAKYFYSHYSDEDINWHRSDGKPVLNWKLEAREWSRRRETWTKSKTSSSSDRIDENRRRYEGDAAEETSIVIPLDDDFPF